MQIVFFNRSCVMVFDTSERGICVVTRATLRPSVASIMTTFLVEVFSAKNSVWPVKLNPAALITPL